MLCHDLLNLEKVLLDKAGGVHFPGTVHQIVCLIDQENIVILCLKGEETLEAGSRIKGIIVIADDRITPGTDVKGRRHASPHKQGSVRAKWHPHGSGYRKRHR